MDDAVIPFITVYLAFTLTVAMGAGLMALGVVLGFRVKHPGLPLKPSAQPEPVGDAGVVEDELDAPAPMAQVSPPVRGVYSGSGLVDDDMHELEDEFLALKRANERARESSGVVDASSTLGL